MSDLKNRNNLKSKFKDGDKPSQEDFGELIDSSLNQKSDKIFAVDKKIGIGTNEPQAPLEVRGAKCQVRQSLVASDGENSTFHIAHPQENVVALGGDVGSSMKLGTFGKEASSFQSTMTITAQGIVGIGTKTSKGKLMVNGDVRVRGTLSLGDGALEIKRGQLYVIYNGKRRRVKLELNDPGTPLKRWYWVAIITGIGLLILILMGICLELFWG